MKMLIFWNENLEFRYIVKDERGIEVNIDKYQNETIEELSNGGWLVIEKAIDKEEFKSIHYENSDATYKNRLEPLFQ